MLRLADTCGIFQPKDKTDLFLNGGGSEMGNKWLTSIDDEIGPFLHLGQDLAPNLIFKSEGFPFGSFDPEVISRASFSYIN